MIEPQITQISRIFVLGNGTLNTRRLSQVGVQPPDMGKTAMKIIASPIYAEKSGNQFLRKVFKLYLPNTVSIKYAACRMSVK